MLQVLMSSQPTHGIIQQGNDVNSKIDPWHFSERHICHVRIPYN